MYLNDLIYETHMSNWVSLLHQDLLQMLHLKTCGKEPFIVFTMIGMSCDCHIIWSIYRCSTSETEGLSTEYMSWQ